MAKEKRKGKLKAFFEEFKKFIMRGNVLDMSVGVIVGGAFTGVVNGLSNYILKPLINALLWFIFGNETEGLEGVITVLIRVETDGALDLTNSIYIDWGAFISAIINFLLIAIVLFSIVKVMNNLADMSEQMRNNPEWNKRKAIAKIRLEERMTRKQAKAEWLKRYEAEKARIAEEKRIADEKAAEEKRIAEEKATANTRLLEEIRDLLKANIEKR